MYDSQRQDESNEACEALRYTKNGLIGILRVYSSKSFVWVHAFAAVAAAAHHLHRDHRLLVIYPSDKDKIRVFRFLIGKIT